MRRWGQIAEHKSDDWYMDIAKKVYRPDIYMAAAQELVKEGHIAATDLPKTDGFKAPQDDFMDGVVYDGRKPNAYIESMKIGLKGKDKI